MKPLKFLLVVLFSFVVVGNVFAIDSLKKTVAVFEFKNDSGAKAGPKLARDFTMQLTDALTQSGKFN